MNRSHRLLAAAAIAIAILSHNIIQLHRVPPAELALGLQTNETSQLKVFFDTGHGFDDVEPIVETILASTAPREYFFSAWAGKLRAIRIELAKPATNLKLGAASIQRPVSHLSLRQFDLATIKPADQCTSLSLRNGTLMATPVDASLTPQLTLRCKPSMSIRYSAQQIFSTRFFRINALWSAFAILLVTGYASRNRWRPTLLSWFAPIDRRFETWSQHFAQSAWLPLDKTAWWYYTLCIAVFVTLAMAGIHGSSISIFSKLGPSSVKHQPIAGQVRFTRVDEWNYHTPAILNQLLRSDRLEAQSSTFGHDKAALFGNIPTHHWTELFRPQFWPFHWLPAELAYSCYWQFKGLILLTGTFSLLLLLSRSSSAAIFGAIWYFFSSHTQWSYSWPSLLPEMVGLFGWTICLGAYLTVGRNRWPLIPAAALCIIAAVNFALCIYPPHQIPLVIFGFAILAWWFWTRADLIFSRDQWRVRAFAIGFCLCSILTIMGLFYLDVQTGFHQIAQTFYPGQRSSTGGTISTARLLSHFMDFWKTETHYPPKLDNICEATGYLWLAPIALLIPSYSAHTSRIRLALLFLWLAFLVIASWMLFPIPAAIGKVLLLDKVTPNRCFPALGLINIAIVVVAITSSRLVTPQRSLLIRNLCVAFSLGLLLFGGLTFMNSVYDHFFRFGAILVATGIPTFSAICILQQWRGLFYAGLLLPTIATTALINPVDRGLDVVLTAPLSKMVKDRPELRAGRWLAFSSWVAFPGFISACGVDLMNGLKIIPPLEELGRFDPEGKYRSITNQSCYLVATVKNELDSIDFECPHTGVVLWRVNPMDPRLKEIGIRYLAFETEPNLSVREKLKLVFREESTGISVYEL